jgi:hypothetical protein
MSREQSNSIPAIVWVVPAVALAIALFPLPYGYYTLLRVVVCLAAIVIAADSHNKPNAGAWPLAFIALAIIFNPIIPLHLGRTVWLPVDIAAALIFAGHLWWIRQQALRAKQASAFQELTQHEAQLWARLRQETGD